jgi:hypothetical protein
MAVVTKPGPFVTQPSKRLIETAEDTTLRRAVGALDLTALGIGAVIGTGISSSSARRSPTPAPGSCCPSYSRA